MERFILESKRVAQDLFVLLAFANDSKVNFAVKRKTKYGNYIPVEVFCTSVSDDIFVEMDVVNGAFEPLSSELQIIANMAWSEASKIFKQDFCC